MSSALLSMPHAYRSMIVDLHEAGGAAKRQIDGRVKVPAKGTAPERYLNGSPTDWLGIVERGLLAGDGERLVLTEAGREEAERVVASRTRKAAGF